MSIKYFEDITLKLGEEYDVSIDYAGHEVSILIVLEEEEVTLDLAKVANQINDFLENLESKDALYQKMIKENFNSDDSVVKNYIEHHLEECDAKSLVSFVDSKSEQNSKQQLLDKFVLTSITIMPTEDTFASVDYMPFEDNKFLDTDYLISLECDSNGEVLDISMES